MLIDYFRANWSAYIFVSLTLCSHVHTVPYGFVVGVLSPENWSGENVSGGPKILVRRTNIFNGKMVLGLIFHGNTVPHRKKWSARRTENFSPPDQYFQWKNGPSTNFPWKYGPSSKKMVRSGMARAVFAMDSLEIWFYIVWNSY